jgi:hypothetical protein
MELPFGITSDNALFQVSILCKERPKGDGTKRFGSTYHAANVAFLSLGLRPFPEVI